MPRHASYSIIRAMSPYAPRLRLWLTSSSRESNGFSAVTRSRQWFRVMSCATEQDFWTLRLEKVMILSRGTSFSAEGYLTLTHMRGTDWSYKDVKVQRTDT